MAAIPSAAANSVFPSDQYRLGLRWCLGMSVVVGDPLPAFSGCGMCLDALGDHLLCCKRINFAHRHNLVQETFMQLLQQAGQGVAREQVIPDCDIANLRPADLLLRHWDGGRDTAVDFTVVHGWQVVARQPEAGPATRERWRAFLRKKEQAKRDKYDGPCVAAGWAFQPAAFGCWGGLGPEAARLLAVVSKRVAGWLEGSLRASHQEQARQQVGLAVYRGVIALLEAKAYVHSS